MITGGVKFGGDWEAARNGLERLAGHGNNSVLFSPRQLRDLGSFAIDTIKARVAKGIGSDDRPMPPLKGVTKPNKSGGPSRRQSYAQFKSRHGLQPIRDLRGVPEPHMLDDISVMSVSGDTVRIGFTTDYPGRLTAMKNEKRSPFFSISDGDQGAITAYAQDMLDENVAVIALEMGAK